MTADDLLLDALRDIVQGTAREALAYALLTAAVEAAEALVEWDNLPDTPRLRAAAAAYRAARAAAS